MPQIDDDLNRLTLPPEPADEGSPKKLWLLIGAGVLALLGLVLVLLLSRSRAQSVRLAEAELRTRWSDAVVLISTGHIEPEKRVFATALSPGRIAKIVVTAGQDVGADAVVAMLDARLLEAAYVEAKAGVLAAKARVRLARKMAARAKKEKDDQHEKLAAAQTALRAAIAEEKAAVTKVGGTKLALQHAAVRSPMQGRVWKVLVNEGASLAEGALQVAEIVDLSSLYIDADVAEAKLGKIRVGMDADVVLDAFADKHFDAKVVALKDEIDRQASTGVVRLKLLEPAADMLVGMAARVSFLSRAVPLGERTAGANVLVPKSALVEHDGKSFVFLYTQGVVTETPVGVGMARGDDVEVLSGLKPGSRIVAAPPAGLTSGDHVELAQ